MDTEECLKQIALGSLAALEELYRSYNTTIYSLALAISRNRHIADDVVQDTFIKIHSKAHTYTPGTNPKAWIISIARNISYDYLRSRNGFDVYDMDVHINGMGDQISEADIITEKLELTEAMLSLDIEERQIVIMHVIAGMKHCEISSELGIPQGTVRWKYKKALERMTHFMGGENHAK